MKSSKTLEKHRKFKNSPNLFEFFVKLRKCSERSKNRIEKLVFINTYSVQAVSIWGFLCRGGKCRFGYPRILSLKILHSPHRNRNRSGISPAYFLCIVSPTNYNEFLTIILGKKQFLQLFSRNSKKCFKNVRKSQKILKNQLFVSGNSAKLKQNLENNH